MTREAAVLITVGIALALLVLMAWAWRRRVRRDSGLSAPLGEADAAAVTTRADILYVATTRHGQPLERLAIRPLAYRSRGQATLGSGGLGLELDGAASVLIPPASLHGVERSTWTIDRVVEPGGLVRVSWSTPEGTPVDSYLRLTAGDPTDFIRSLEPLCTGNQTGASA